MKRIFLAIILILLISVSFVGAKETYRSDEEVATGNAAAIHAGTAKTTPADADEMWLWDSVTSLYNKITWANIIATLDTLYAPVLSEDDNYVTDAEKAIVSSLPAATAKGDIITGTGAGAYATTSVGTNGYIPNADSGQTGGIGWINPTSLESTLEGVMDLQDLQGATTQTQLPSTITGTIVMEELSADPSNPDEGVGRFWISDGTGTGDDGDLYFLNTAGGSTQKIQITDHSLGMITGDDSSILSVKDNDVQVGGADIQTLNFSGDFTVTESPDQQINISLNLSNYDYENMADILDKAVAVWSFVGGSYTDLSGNSNTLTALNTPVSTTGHAGKSSSAIDYEADDGDSLFILDASQTDLALSGSMTISAWVKVESLSSARHIVAKWNWSGQNSYLLYIETTGLVRFSLSSDGSATSATEYTTAGDIVVGNLYHICARYDQTEEEMSIFIDGVLASGTPTSYSGSVYDSTSPVNVGLNTFDGIIDDVSIFDSALTDDEILALATADDDFLQWTCRIFKNLTNIISGN